MSSETLLPTDCINYFRGELNAFVAFLPQVIVRFRTMKEPNKHSFLLSRQNSRYEIAVPSHKNNFLNRLFNGQLNHVYAQKNIDPLLFIPGIPGLAATSVC